MFILWFIVYTGFKLGLEEEIMNRIEQAVAPLKDAAIERAEIEAKKIVDKVNEQLTAANNDLQICAPYPRHNGGNVVKYQSEYRKYQLFHSLCRCRQGSHRPNDPCYADIDPEYVTKFIENSRSDAALQYDAFIAKLIAKIGSVREATLTGDHVWSFSILTVTKEDGAKENWKTQMIVNVSKLGKLFNQWPTRKVGGAK